VDEAKRFAEALTVAFQSKHGVETRIVRIFNTYGPRMRPDDGRVIPMFFNQAIHGQPLTICGDGSQTRSFCYVDDLVAGILAVMKGSFVGPLNLGNPEEVDIVALAREILALTGSTCDIEYKGGRSEEPRQRKPDISLVQSTLGWRPRIPREEGLLRTWKDLLHRDHVASPEAGVPERLGDLQTRREQGHY
jgi:dTDP-glucose 4,6-dehydratase